MDFEKLRDTVNSVYANILADTIIGKNLQHNLEIVNYLIQLHEQLLEKGTALSIEVDNIVQLKNEFEILKSKIDLEILRK